MDAVSEKMYRSPDVKLREGNLPHLPSFKKKIPGRMQQQLIRWYAKLYIVILALKAYGSLSALIKSIDKFNQFKKMVAGRNGKRKLVVKGGKVWFGLYVPSFPSEKFNRHILTEFNRYMPHKLAVNALQQVNYAITSHCPMGCEHCFEWNNLNKPEAFSLDELHSLISLLQKDGLGHISLSGGEPMVRFQDMIQLIEKGSKQTEWWVLTSGFNLTYEKAVRLKKAGASGVIVSIDHYLPEVNNLFRGHNDAFAHATHAVSAANRAGLVTAVSVCITRPNASFEFLLKHAQMAARLGADFIQWFEPRAEGHYSGLDVTLNEKQVQLLEQTYEAFNFEKEFGRLPLIIYHGFHQRRIGCLSAGKFSFYVDSAGWVHSCAFCHSKDFNVREWLQTPMDRNGKISACKAF